MLFVPICSEVAKAVRDRVAAEITAIKDADFAAHSPRLDVIIVGGRKDSVRFFL